MRSISIIGLLGILLAVGVGCSRQSDQEIVVYTSVDQVFSEPVFRAFEQVSGIRVRAVFDTEETKSTGILNRLIAERGNPRADVFWSGYPRGLQGGRRNLDRLCRACARAAREPRKAWGPEHAAVGSGARGPAMEGRSRYRQSNVRDDHHARGSVVQYLG